MQRIVKSTLKTVGITLIALGIFSCSKEDVNRNNLDETLFVRHKNADMPAYIHGNGSEKVFLIILHGGPGGNGILYRNNTIRTEIEKNNAVIYFDQRGSGNSQGNYSEKDVSIDIMAEDVLALAKVIKAKYGDDSKLFLMGHSWGGVLGSAVLLKNQNVFSGWIDVNGDHSPKDLYDRYKVAFKQTAEAQIALGNSVAFWKNTLDLVQNVGLNYSLDDFFKLNITANNTGEVLAKDKVINEERADFEDSFISNNKNRFSWNKNKLLEIFADKGLYEKVSFTDRLSEITIPSIVLWGKYDLTVPLIYATEAFDNLGATDKELFIFEKSGHSPMFTEPDLFADKVIEFINRHK